MEGKNVAPTQSLPEQLSSIPATSKATSSGGLFCKECWSNRYFIYIVLMRNRHSIAIGII
ncbi:unnamed protein product [Nesidiocoris tenuis]|uniref:Uncharacterized protein n=1 Tax=Nesidiocoris tenuis TaxID=355587 RepID=A0A6H5HHC5_9HEMI|nr:unnamed protein product [Nesidiocoris tenuis]